MEKEIKVKIPSLLEFVDCMQSHVVTHLLVLLHNNHNRQDAATYTRTIKCLSNSSDFCGFVDHFDTPEYNLFFIQEVQWDKDRS